MKDKQYKSVLKLTTGGLLLAAGVVIPLMFHIFGISEFGKMFLPMHLSVFVAGVFLGRNYGIAIGFLTPLLNSIFGMPFFPMNVIMACELAAYGFFSGLFTSGNSSLKIFGMNIKIQIGMLLSMIAGRFIYGTALYVAVSLLGMERLPKPLSIIAATVVGLPGIIIQLVFVPAIVYALRKITKY